MMLQQKQFRHESTLKLWAMAVRPRTLPAAMAPVLAGTALALADHAFRFFPATAAFLVALLLQIGVNLANDYFDYKKGIDTPERLGPVRVTQSGLISPATVKNGMIIVFSLTGIIGIYLVFVGGWPIFFLGVASIVSALAYSGGPFPLASNALGELFVFIFFGLVAVCGTYYVQALSINAQVFCLSIPVGLLITAIMVVNNLRDMATDAKSGKITLAVILGRKGSLLEYRLLVYSAYLFLPIYYFYGLISLWGLLPLISFPMAFQMIHTVKNSQAQALNQALAGTARLALIFSALLALGIILK
jgi:1,4-dihydroxy-2-naphthoate polyprenyltransferase